jgi:hypothetical protein
LLILSSAREEVRVCSFDGVDSCGEEMIMIGPGVLLVSVSISKVYQTKFLGKAFDNVVAISTGTKENHQ